MSLTVNLSKHALYSRDLLAWHFTIWGTQVKTISIRYVGYIWKDVLKEGFTGGRGGGLYLGELVHVRANKKTEGKEGVKKK